MEDGVSLELILCFARIDDGGTDVNIVDANTVQVLWKASIGLPTIYPRQIVSLTRQANRIVCAEEIEDVTTSLLLPGVRVETHSLTTAAFNGKIGRVKGSQGGRFQVVFDDTQYGGKALKASNLRVVGPPDVAPHTWDSSALPLVHIDPPARIDQGEAAEIVAQQEAGWTERLVPSAPAYDSEGPSDLPGRDGEELWKIELKR